MIAPPWFSTSAGWKIGVGVGFSNSTGGSDDIVGVDVDKGVLMFDMASG